MTVEQKKNNCKMQLIPSSDIKITRKQIESTQREGIITQSFDKHNGYNQFSSEVKNSKEKLYISIFCVLKV